MEELGLERDRQFCDLVQVDRALVGILELPWFPPVGAGEGAPLVAEEFGLEELLRDRCTVHLDEGTVAATGYGMDRARDQIFSHRSEEHTSELQSLAYLVCRLLLEKKKKKNN